MPDFSPGLTLEELKTDIFDGPHRLIKDPDFEKSMNEVELEAWKASVQVVNFLDNNKARNYIELFLTYGSVS